MRATTGRGGYIDVFQSGVFIGEAKSVGADLVKAHDQALDYLAGGSIGQHEFPKYVLVTDFARIRIDRLGDESWSVEFPVGQSPEHLDELLFLAGHETVTRAEEQDASIHAARLMAGLYAAMVGVCLHKIHRESSYRHVQVVVEYRRSTAAVQRYQPGTLLSLRRHPRGSSDRPHREIIRLGSAVARKVKTSVVAAGRFAVC